MIQAFVELLKQFARPTSVTFLVAVLIAGVVLAFNRRTQRTARWYLAALLAFFWLASTPAIVESLLVRAQARYRPIATIADARGARTVVVLGAGNATIQAGGRSLNLPTWAVALRLLEGARLYHLLDRPTVIVSGGITRREPGARSEADAMRSALLDLGVPSDHFVIEAESKTTRDEALVIARMLSDKRTPPIALVTSATHMPRALAVFRAAGLEPIPAVAQYKSEHSLEHLRWLPNDLAFVMFDGLVYDTAASWYYWLRGWSTP
jgi:uncharacterized SAM-binding protein YcdF (DUF218 family)